MGIQNPVFERFGADTSVSDGMNRTDPGACQHGNRQFRDHRQIDAHPITLLNAVLFQYIGKSTDLSVKLLKGKCFLFAGSVPFPDEGGFVSSSGDQMTIQTIHRKVQFSPYKPLMDAFTEILLQYR
jgi:hypothetical protein